MTHFRIRLAVRAFLAFVSPTVAHADVLRPPKLPENPMICTKIGNIMTCEHYNPTCATGYEFACQQRDHGTDGLRRSEQGR